MLDFRINKVDYGYTTGHVNLSDECSTIYEQLIDPDTEIEQVLFRDIILPIFNGNGIERITIPCNSDNTISLCKKGNNK